MSNLHTLETRSSQGFSDSGPAVLTAREAAHFLGLAYKTVRKMVLRGELPAWRVGQGPRAKLRFRRRALEIWMQDRERQLQRDLEAGS